MNKIVSAALAAAFVAGSLVGTASIAAADGVKKDGTFQVAAEMKKDDKMAKDAAMKKDEMAKDGMAKGDKMKDETMAKDDMKKKEMKTN